MNNTIYYITGIFDKPLSFLAIRFNKVIIESFYFSKINLLKIFIKSSIFPSFYQNTFNEEKFKNKKKIDKKKRENFFTTNKEIVSDFEKYIFFALQMDFPTSYFEDFDKIDKQNSSINNLKKKLIFTMISHVSNERFKIWLAKMLGKGSKLFVAEHGGFLKYKINGFFEHELKICEKSLTWQKTGNKKEFQITPVQLLKAKKLKQNNPGSLLIINCETVKYPVKIQSWPYAEQYKLGFNSVCNFVENLNSEIYKKVIYRSNNFGYNTSSQFISKFKDLKCNDTFSTKMHDDFSKSKMIICNYPDTPLTEAIIADIPTIVMFSRKLYQISEIANEILLDLKKNNILFENPIEASNHINQVWNNPREWWDSKNTQDALKKLSNYAFKMRDDWDIEWSNFITNERYHLNKYRKTF